MARSLAQMNWPNLAEAVRNGAATVILPLFSPRSARLAAAAVEGASAPLQPVAISPAAGAAWAGARPEPARIALRPDAAAILDAVRAAAAAAAKKEHSRSAPG